MVASCCAFNCKERHVKGGSVTFHRKSHNITHSSFPKNEEKKKLWEVATQRKNFTSTIHTKICSKHFTEDCFDREKLGGCWLHKDAVPTIFDFPKQLRNPKTSRKPPKQRTPLLTDVQHEEQCVDETKLSIDMTEAKHSKPKKRKSYRYASDFDEKEMQSRAKGKEHFTEDCFDREKLGGCSLCQDAVPAIFDIPKQLHKPKTSQKPPKERILLVDVQPTEQCVDETKLTNDVNEAMLSNTKKRKSYGYVADFSEEEKQKRKSYRYVGDFSEKEMHSPAKAKESLNLAKSKIAEQRSSIKALRRKTHRLEKKVANLKTNLQSLRKEMLGRASATELLQKTLPGPGAELLKRASSSTIGELYSPELRTFALELYFYSGKAYDYVRKTFKTSLPHPSTLRKWCQAQVVDRSPGLTSEATNGCTLFEN